MGVPGSANLLLLGGQQGYQIERSLRFNSADSAYCSRVPASTGNRKTWTWSGWVKRAATGYQVFFAAGDGTISNRAAIEFDSEQLRLVFGDGTYLLTSTQVFRDFSAWYHFVISIDTTQSTAANRARLYVNGSEITAFATSSYPVQNYDTFVNATNQHVIGARYRTSVDNYFNGYLTEVHFIDGQALTPSSFGETDTITGVWKPKKYAGTYGTNGFYLNFKDNSSTSALGTDYSGNSNTWTTNNFSVTAGAGNDSLIDTPTPYADGGNGRGNYCTLNPLSSSSVATLSNGNLDVNTGTTGGGLTLGTFAMPQSGKWYWEVTPTSIGSAACRIGIANTLRDTNVEYYNDGTKVVNGASTSYGASYTDNDVIGIACDIGGNTVTFYKNNSSQGSISFSSWSTVTVFPMIADGSGSLGVTAIFNFGQRPFSYTVPAGFSALNTQNLPEPSIKKPSSYMDVKLYSGTNASQSITGLGFSPDLIWFKNRTGTAYHGLFDSVRGRAAGLSSNVTDAESTSSAGNDLVSFDANGFTLGPVQNWNSTNGSGNSIVAWCWDESATPGFDIVTYTGNGTARTIAHSLGVAPSMMIVKQRTTASGGGPYHWHVYHSSLGAGKYLMLSSTNSEASDTTTWNNTAPTSSVFSVGNYDATNRSPDTFVAYLWSEVAGFSKFGSYTGNGSSDGPFVFCGFRPRWVMIKRTDGAGSWFMIDTARGSYNVVNPYVMANVSNAEATDLSWDILSNGFKLRSSYTDINTSSGTYVFAAFSESAFKYALAR